MDLLQQYNQNMGKQHTPLLEKNRLEGQGFIIRLFFKISGERVKSIQTANYILIGISLLILLFSFITLIIGGIL